MCIGSTNVCVSVWQDDSDSQITVHRRLVVKVNYLAVNRPDILYAASIMESHIEPERCGHGHAQASGTILDLATHHLDCDQTTSCHTLTVIGAQWAT